MIDELTQLAEVVVATGGGAVLREENRRVLRERGTVIYLMTTVEQQLKRTAKDRNRPLLQCANREQVLNDMFAARDPLYRATSDITVRTDRRSPRAVVNEILRRVHRLIDPLDAVSAPTEEGFSMTEYAPPTHAHRRSGRA